jgi:hypothetical protein
MISKKIVSGSSRKRGNSFSEFSKTRLDQAADLFRRYFAAGAGVMLKASIRIFQSSPSRITDQ